MPKPSRTSEPSRRTRLSVGHVALAAGWVAFAIGSRGSIRDNSFLWHVRAGALQLTDGAVLTSDPFSYTMTGSPWRTQSWLAELGYGWAERMFALDFVGPLLIVCGAVFLVAVALVVFPVDGRPFSVATFLVLTTIVQIGFWNPRPVVLSYVLFPLLMLAERDRKLRWTVPLVLWVWAGVHGSFVIGAAYLVLQAFRRRSRRAVPLIAASALATLSTAHGLGVLETLVAFARNQEALEGIREWATPDLLEVPFMPVLAGIFLLMVAARYGKLGSRDAFVVVPFVVLMFTANRAVPSSWMALAPFVMSGLSKVRWPSSPPTRLQGAVNGVVIAALLLVPLTLPRPGGLSETDFPVKAVRFLEGAHLFHDDAAGGFIIYDLWPQRSVFVDDRAELYGERLNEFVRVRGGSSEWATVFERDRIDEALLRVSDPLAETLRLAGWRESFRDANWVLMHP